MAIVSVIAASAVASSASAAVVPSGGDFQSTPPTWTASALQGTLNTVSASQASSGANRFYRTQYTTPANLLGSGLLGMAATEGITSPTFTWSQASPQTLVASYDRGASFSGVLGVDADAGIGMYLQNLTTGTETLLSGERLTQSSADFSTVTTTVNPSLLSNGDSYRVQVRETFAPTVQLAGSATIDLDNVGLTATPAVPPAPTLTSGSAAIANVTSSSATAGASIDPGSADTTVDVNYGTTTAYGSTTSTQTIPANSGTTAVSIPISGLAPSTTYHAKITATNAGGGVSSNDLTFTTQATTPSTPAPTVGSGSAQGTPGEHSATLGTTINDAGAGSSYYVEYGTSTGYGSATPPQTNPSGATGATTVTSGLSNLQPATTYHARYVVTSSGGTTDGNDFTFTTAATSPPTLGTTGARTTSADGTQETVDAVVNPGANDTQVAVSYGASSSYGTTTSSVLVSAGTGTQTVSIPITGLTAGSTYHYAVTAANADGSVSSADATFSPSAQTSPPVGQTSLSAGPDEHSATLAATIDTGGNGGTYLLQYGTDTSYASQTASQNLSATSGNQPLSATLTGLAPNTTYHARFVAMVNGHPASDGSDVQFTTAPASPPAITSGPSAATSDSAGDQETISATVDPGSHDTQVTVAYGTSTAYGTTTPATSVMAGSGATTVSIPITGLTAGTQYHYRVTATNDDGSVRSGDATFTPTASTSPAVGATSATSGPGESSVTLGASIDTGGNGGTYALQYGTDTSYGSQTASENLTATSGSQPLSASLTQLEAGTTYHARFVALVNGHPASYGSDYTFTTTAPPSFASVPTAATTDDTGDQETISASVIPGGLQTRVTVSYGSDSSYGSTTSPPVTVAAGAGAQTVQIAISGLTAGATYHYRVNATNADGTVNSSDDTFTPLATTHPPVGTTSTAQDPGQSSATLDAAIDTGGNGGTYYVEYGTDTGYGSQTPTQSLSATNGGQPLSATLSGLTPGTTYHARFVVAVNGHIGNSDGGDYTFTTAATPAGGGGTTTTTTTSTTPSPVPSPSPSPAPTSSTPSTTTSTATTTSPTKTTTSAPTPTPNPTPTPVPTSGRACAAAYVSASARTLQMVSVPAGAQLTAHRGLRVTLARGLRTAGKPTFQLPGGRRMPIRHGSFSIALAQLRFGRSTPVRIVATELHPRRAVTLSLRITATGCGIQLTSAHAGSASLLSLRMPLGARRVAFTLPRAMPTPTAISLTTSTDDRSLALAGTGAKLHLRRGAGALRVTARGSSITVSGLTRTTTGLSLRFPASHARGMVTARISQRSGGPRSAHVRLG